MSFPDSGGERELLVHTPRVSASWACHAVRVARLPWSCRRSGADDSVDKLMDKVDSSPSDRPYQSFLKLSPSVCCRYVLTRELQICSFLQFNFVVFVCRHSRMKFRTTSCLFHWRCAIGPACRGRAIAGGARSRLPRVRWRPARAGRTGREARPVDARAIECDGRHGVFALAVRRCGTTRD